ncbi:MAG: NADH-quinone oxidoreductase subunit A [Candidatus Polarisedimenticolia bacterium]|nr:NADH-quinone oxidoreductase subunit A [bacterium]
MVEYLPILIMLAVGVALPAAAFIFAKLIAPRRVEDMKYDTYECGLESPADVREKFSIRYYVIAVLFVVFDVETIFMFPWAVRFRALGLFGLTEMALFIAILVVGYVYVWKEGALKWE